MHWIDNVRDIAGFDVERWVLRVGSFGVVGIVLILVAGTFLLRQIHRQKSLFILSMVVLMDFTAAYLLAMAGNFAGVWTVPINVFTLMRIFLLISGLQALPPAAAACWRAFDEEVVQWWRARRMHRRFISPEYVRDTVLTAAIERFPNLAGTLVLADESGTIRHVSTEVTALLGHTPEWLYGKDLTVLMPEEMRDTHVAGMNRYLETGEGRLIGAETDIEALHRDGRAIPVRLELHAFSFADETWFLGVLHKREVSV